MSYDDLLGYKNLYTRAHSEAMAASKGLMMTFWLLQQYMSCNKIHIGLIITYMLLAGHTSEAMAASEGLCAALRRHCSTMAKTLGQ